MILLIIVNYVRNRRIQVIHYDKENKSESNWVTDINCDEVKAGVKFYSDIMYGQVQWLKRPFDSPI
jgi:hypothetical protein